MFGPGRHTLETENIPMLRRFLNIPTGGNTPFHCEVYFINKTEQMAIRWGTDSKVQYVEPTYGFPLAIGANGEMSLTVDDSRNLLISLVGTEAILDRQYLTTYFRAFLMTRVKTYLAQAIATKRQQEGYTYQQERGFDVAELTAQNEAVEQFTNMGIGLGTMAGVGSVVSRIVVTAINGAVEGINNKLPTAPTTIVKHFCDKCGTKQEAPPLTKCPDCGFEFTRPGKFCPKCGFKREGRQ